MMPQQYEIVRQLFIGLCDLTPARQREALEQAYFEEPLLRAEVLSLLEEDARISKWRCDPERS